MRLFDLAREAAALDLESFASRWADPALVLLPGHSTAPAAMDDTDQLALEGFEYGMALPRREPSPTEHEKVEPFGASEVVFLKRALRTGARQRILVGRGIPNHIVLSTPSVSFVHAWFEVREDGWALTDAGSSNGTFVDERNLRVGFPEPLANGARIGFGLEVQGRFFLPEGLFDYLGLYRSKASG